MELQDVKLAASDDARVPERPGLKTYMWEFSGQRVTLEALKTDETRKGCRDDTLEGQDMTGGEEELNQERHVTWRPETELARDLVWKHQGPAALLQWRGGGRCWIAGSSTEHRRKRI